MTQYKHKASGEMRNTVKKINNTSKTDLDKCIMRLQDKLKDYEIPQDKLRDFWDKI